MDIVIDADQNLEVSWRKVLKILSEAGYDDRNLPAQPDINGTIIKQEFKPIFGIWIMPDNELRGILEDFLNVLIPDKEANPLWAQAVECSQEILDVIEVGRRFSEKDLSKAQMHAYLAWQKEPGIPFGRAITAKYLQADNPGCLRFVEWLRRLFVAPV